MVGRGPAMRTTAGQTTNIVGPQNGISRRSDEADDAGEGVYGRRLSLPSTIPGAQAPRIHLPPYDPEHPEARNRIVALLFPDLPKMWPLDLPQPTPERPAMSLRELQELALQYNPTLIQARANVTSVLGDAIQAGTYPNPMVGFEQDTVGSSLTRDYQGIYFSQWVVTANKLGLARAVANVDTMNAQLQLRKTRYEVLSQVKAAYFMVLVAQQNMIVSDAFVRLVEDVFRIKRSRAKAEAAPYEPAQLRGLADLSRAQLILARNSYVAAWKTLAARLGLPQMPRAALQGRADMPVPVLTFEAALNRTLSVHPDINMGRNMQAKARTALRLEQVRPIPDVFVYGTFQKDFTTPGVPSTSYNTQVGVPLPLWNFNRGNILSAQGDLGQARQQLRRAEVDLSEQLANTFARYETSRFQLQMYTEHVLPDYARAFRGTYERHNTEPNQVGFEDVILVLQNLQGAVADYIGALSGQWAAVADLANLMQVEDLEDMSAIGGGPPTPARAPLPPPVPEPVPPPPGEPRRPAAPRPGGRR